MTSKTSVSKWNILYTEDRNGCHTTVGSFYLFSLCVTTIPHVYTTCISTSVASQNNPLVPWLLSRLLCRVAGSGVCTIDATHPMFPRCRYKSNSYHWQEYTEATAQSWGTTRRPWPWAEYVKHGKDFYSLKKKICGFLF